MKTHFHLERMKLLADGPLSRRQLAMQSAAALWAQHPRRHVGALTDAGRHHSTWRDPSLSWIYNVVPTWQIDPPPEQENVTVMLQPPSLQEHEEMTGW